MEEILEKSQASRYQRWLLSGLILLLLIAGAIYFLIGSFDNKIDSTDSARNADGSKNLGLVQPTNLNQYRREGNFEAALQELERIQSKPLKDLDEQALAVLSSINLKFNVTADVNDMLADIQNLKKIFINPKVDLRVRVDALNAISASVCRSGRDPVIFNEVYKDAPFNAYLASNDPDLSARYMAEWSYSQLPTSFAAVRIVRWDSDQMLENKSISPETRVQYGEETKRYLNMAGQLVERELQRKAGYAKSIPYIAYKTWRAIAIGRLAAVEGEPYKSQYKKEFEDFFTYIYDLKDVGALEYVFLSRHFYARVLLDEDATAAKKQLDILARELNELENPDTSTYVRWLRNSSRYSETGHQWQTVKNMMKISPDFKATVEKFLATTPQ